MKHTLSFIILFSLFTFTAFAQDTETKEKFPKSGYVKSDSVEVKAGDNANFETLCGLTKSDTVKIIDKRYSWYKIILPRKAALYISKDYVTLTSNEKGIGIVNGTNVNLRAGAGTRFSIIGQVSKPEKVYILSEDSGWYKIEPPYGTAGWINSNHIAIVEEGQIKKSEQKEVEPMPKEAVSEKASSKTIAQSQARKKDTPDSTVRLNASFPIPKEKGNLTIR